MHNEHAELPNKGSTLSSTDLCSYSGPLCPRFQGVLVDATQQSRHIVGLNVGSGESNSVQADSAYDCCVAAFTHPKKKAVSFVHSPDPGTSAGACDINFVTDSCPAGQSIRSTLITAPDATNNEKAVVGNGNCGQVT